MSKVMLIARHEYRMTVVRPGFVIMTLLMPLLGGLTLLIASLFGASATGYLERQMPKELSHVAVVDLSGIFTPLLPAYAGDFALYESEAAARADVAAGKVDGALVIQGGYTANGDVTVITTGHGLEAALLSDSSRVRAMLIDHLLRDQVPESLRQRVRAPMHATIVSLADVPGASTTAAGAGVNMLVSYFLGVLLVVTIFTSSGYLLRSVAEEKTNRVMEVLLSSVTAQQLLAGKVLGLGAAGLTQMLIWLGSSAALGSGAIALLGVSLPFVSRPEVFILAIVYYLLGFVLYAVLMGAGGSLGSNLQESQQIAGIFSFMAAIPFMLAGFLLTSPNAMIGRVLSWFPFTAPTMMLLRLPMTELPPIDILISIVSLLVTIPFALWGGAKVFRMGLLMYGKRPSLREVWRTLRQA
jgi:ABC-2 type transport system permease protein